MLSVDQGARHSITRLPPAPTSCSAGPALAAVALLVLSACEAPEPKPSFVRIEDARVDVYEHVIVAGIHLRELPAALPFNAPEVKDNHLEYEWRVVFDVDRDNSRANDIAIALAKFKYPGSEPGLGAVEDFAQQSVVQADEAGRSFLVIAHSTVRREGDSLVLGVDKRQHPDLSLIDPSTPWRVQAFINQGEESAVEFFPGNGGYFRP